MELNINVIGVTFVVIVFGGLTWWFVNRKRKFNVFKDVGIPGPKPHFIYGNYAELWGETGIKLKVLDKWLCDYGKVFGYFIGTRPVTVISDLSLIKNVLVRDSQIFTNRPQVNVKPISDTLVGLRNQRWKEVRNVLTPTFSAAKMKLMTGIMNEIVGRMIEFVNTETQRCNVLEMHETYERLTGQVIGECALAMNLNAIEDNKDKFLVSVRQYLKFAINPFVRLIFYFPEIGPFIQIFNKMFSLSRRGLAYMFDHLRKVIDERRQDMDNVHTVDVVQLMLEASLHKHIAEEGAAELGNISQLGDRSRKALLTDDEIVGNSWVFLIAGFETTSLALAFTTYLLAKHPDIQERLFDELESKLESDEPSYNDIRSLVYLEQVLCESLRMYPPVVLFVSREVEKTITVDNVTFPAKSQVMAHVWQIHHDPDLWPDPYTFDPERFHPDVRSTHPSMSWIPFGAGPRNCIGIRFAQLEAKLTLARMLRKFRFSVCAETDDPPELCIPTVTLKPKNGLNLKVELRERIED